jgi:uncharacterized protein Smg (DUF494 family)
MPQQHPGRKAKKVVIADRRTEMVKMRLAGHTYAEIAETLDYTSATAASKDFSRVLESQLAEQRTSIEVYRETEILRLDGELERLTRLYAKVERILDKFHVTVQFGKVITVDGEPLEDDSPALAAVDRLIRIEDARRRNSERRSKLLGLDAAQRLEVTIDDLDAEAARLNELLAASEGEAAAAAGDQAPPG